MAALDLFTYAYALAVVAYILSIGAWLLSKTVHQKGRLSRQQRRRGAKQYRVRTYAGCVLLTILLLGVMKVISRLQLRSELLALAGKLYPGSYPTPGNGCEKDASKFLFLFGNDGNGALVAEKDFPHTVVMMDSNKAIPESAKGCPVLSVGRNEQDGFLYVIMDIRDKNNKLSLVSTPLDFRLIPIITFECTVLTAALFKLRIKKKIQFSIFDTLILRQLALMERFTSMGKS